MITTNYPDRSPRQHIAEITPTSVTQGKKKNDEERFTALHATDKDLMTNAETETDNGAGWLKLTLSKIHLIQKVVIYNRFYTNWYDPSNHCVQSLDKFKGCVDKANNVDVSVHQGGTLQKSCGTLQLTYGLEQSDQIYTLICNTKGNEVKLSKHTGVISVFEVVLIGTGK